MAIPIEGLDASNPIQEKNSTPSTEIPLLTKGSILDYLRQVGKRTGRWSSLTAAGFLSLSQVLACSPQAAQPIDNLPGKPGGIVAAEPGAMATAEAGAAQAAATAFADREIATAQAKPAEIPTAVGQGGGKPEDTSAKPPVQEVLTQEQLVAKVDSIIDKIKNPDPELVAKYPVVEIQAQAQINNILYGADPKSITNAQQFLPNSLAGVRAAIEEENYALARERIIKIFPELSNPFLEQDPQKTDRVILQKPELEILDPDQIFSPASKLDRNVRREVVSGRKQYAVRDTIKLYYSLPPQGK